MKQFLGNVAVYIYIYIYIYICNKTNEDVRQIPKI